MDRREALKKLGLGGAAAVGTSLIVSTPAFAYSLPTQTVAPSVSVTSPGANAVGLTVLDGAVSCPFSAAEPPVTNPQFISRIVTATTVAVGGLFILGLNTLGNNMAGSPTTTASTLTVRKSFFGFLPSSFASNDQFRVDIASTWRCTYRDGTTRDRVLTVSRTFTYVGSSWT